MLFLQFILYSSSFVGTLKNEIPGAALELCQLKLKQFSPDILKLSTKHENNSFTLNCFMVLRTCLSIFDAGSRRLGFSNFRHSSYKEKTAGSARVSRLSFRFLWLWLNTFGLLLVAPSFSTFIFSIGIKLFIRHPVVLFGILILLKQFDDFVHPCCILQNRQLCLHKYLK